MSDLYLPPHLRNRPRQAPVIPDPPKRPRAVTGLTADVDLTRIPEVTDCDPRRRPVEYNVLIATAVAKQVSDGGIHIPEIVQERDELAYQIGRIIRMSPLAFNYDDYPEEERPQIGDLVWFARYAGGEISGHDGRSYRLVKDKDVGAVVET